MQHLLRGTAGRSLVSRWLVSALLKASRGFSTQPNVFSPSIAAKRKAPAGAIIALLLATMVSATPAAAQVMTITGASPSTYSGPGETITFHVSLGGSNAVTNAVELTRIAYGTIGPINCVGLPLDPLESTTCSFTYVTQAGNTFGLNQSGTFRVTTLGAPRTRNIANTFRVPFVPVPPTASIVASTASVAENGAQSLSYTVTLSDPAAAPISVYYALGGNATGGVDYTASGNPLVIATGSTTGTITLDPTGDTNVEPDETVTVNLVASSGYTLGAATSASGTIVNDDTPLPTASIAVSPDSVTEDGAANLVYTVTLSQAPSFATTVNLSTGGTATAGTDYTGGVVSALIAAGSTTGTVTINPAVDATVEANETVILTVVAGAGYTVGAPSSATGTIINDDSAITISPTTLPAMTAGTSFSVTMASTGGTAPYAYSLSSGVLPPGLTLTASGTLSGTPTQRGAYSFIVRSQDAVGGSNARGYSGNVQNPTLSINPTSASTVQGVAFSQALSTTGGVAPYSYQQLAGIWPAGISISSTGVISGTTNATAGIYNFTVRVTDSSTGTGSYSENENFTLTVNPAPSVTITVAPASVSEDGATNLIYTVTRNSNLATPTVVDIATGGTASAGLDYTGTALTVTIPGGATTATVTINPTADNTIEPDETVILGAASGIGYTVGMPFSATGTITNDDVPTLSINNVTLNEGNAGTSNATFTVSLSQPAGPGGVSFDIATANGTASAGVDYAASSLIGQTIPAGSSTYSFSVQVNGDTLNEPNETFFVNLINLMGATAADAQGEGTITNDDVAVTLNPATLPNAAVGAAYSQTLTATGGNGGPYVFAAGVLPAGLSLSSGGVLSGVPTAGGTFNVTLSAIDLAGNIGNQAYSLVVAAPTITVAPATLPSPTVGVAYSQTITAAGGTATYSYAQTAGSLPAGLSLSSAGVLSGTPTTAGASNFTVTATDSSTGTGAYTGSRAYSFTTNVAPPVAGTSAATVAYGSSTNPIFLNLSGGVATSVAVASAATHGTATASGTSITYTPTAGYAGPDSFTYSATNASGTSVAATVTITVSNPTIVVTASGGFAASVGAPYSQTFTWSGGTAPYSGFNVSGLPAGMTISGTTSNSVTISGTPSAAGSFVLSASATDSSTGNGPLTRSQAYTLTVGAPTLALTPAASTLTLAYGAAYSQTFIASGGIGPHGYLLSGILPAGISFNASTGVLSGTPTQPGSFPVTVRATDSSTGAGAPFSVTQSYTLNVPAPTLVVDPATLPGTTAGLAYSENITASGGVAPYSFAVTGGAAPTGLTLSSGGVLSGTTTASGSFTFTVTATDTHGQTAARAYTVVVAAPTLTLTPGTLLTGIAGTAYSQTVSASGGIAPYSVALIGSLPAGLSFNNGVLSGTPTASGSFSFDITATDSTGGTAATVTGSYTLVIAAPTLTLNPGTLPTGIAGTAYSQALTISGGIAPYSVALTGSLPAGLSFNAATQTLSGTPTQSGTFNLSVTATDSTGGTPATATIAYVLTITAPTLTLTPAPGTLPVGSAGLAYQQSFTASGGIAPYAYAISAGALPAGMTLAASGELSGTPTAAGSFNFSVTATDGTAGTPASVTGTYSLTLSVPVITVNPAVLADGMRMVPYQQALNALGGTAPYTFTVSAGTLPVGLVLSGTGAISGSPSTQGTFTFSITATDALGFSGLREYALVIADRPDPTQDPEVRGLLNAQADSTRRFAEAQIGNFQQRLESLHGGGERARMENRVSFMADQAVCAEYVGRMPGQLCDQSRHDETATAEPAVASRNAASHDWAMWVGGAIRSGNHDGRGGDNAVDFETDGLSVGADRRLSDTFVLGAGAGWGRDDSQIGSLGSRSEGEAYTLALYGSYHPGRTWFVDSLLGYQTLSYDLRRRVTANEGLVTGTRDGSQWFGSLSLGADLHRSERMQMTPYARVELARATLDAYTEMGDPLYALRHEKMDVDTTTGNIGLRVDYQHKTHWGVFAPLFRVEYQHDFQGNGMATMRYADLLSGPFYRTELESFDRNRLMIGLGARFGTTRGVSTRFEYRGVLGNGDDSDHGVMLNIEKTF